MTIKTKLTLIMSLIIIYLMGSILSCKVSIEKTFSEREHCLEQYIDSISKTDSYQKAFKALNDTLDQWISLKKYGYQNLNPNNFLIDSCIIFNKDMNRCIAFFCEQMHDSVFYDATQVLGGLRSNDSWYFFDRSYPTTAYQRKYNNNLPYSLQQLSQEGRKQHIIDGLIKPDCTVNYEFIENELNETLRWDPKAIELAPLFGIDPYYKIKK